jgi:hypothetical protein
MTAALYEPLANAMLDLLGATGAEYDWIQLHVGSPGAAGTSNIAAESTRFQVVWDTSAAGVISPTTEVDITSVAATETWTNFTAWTASTGGTVGLRGTVSVGAVLVGADVTIPPESITVTFPLAGA